MLFCSLSWDVAIKCALCWRTSFRRIYKLQLSKKTVTVAFLWTLCCPAEHTPALRWQDIDISGHKAAHQISSSPEQPPKSEQLENTPEALNFWFTTLQINNLQPGSTGTSPHRPTLNGPFTHEELLRSSENYFLEVHHPPCTCRRNLVQFLLPVMWECMWFWPTSRQLRKPWRLSLCSQKKKEKLENWKTSSLISPCKVVSDEMAG